MMKATYTRPEMVRLRWLGPKDAKGERHPDGSVLFLEGGEIHFLAPTKAEPGRLFESATAAMRFFEGSGYCSPAYVEPETVRVKR